MIVALLFLIVFASPAFAQTVVQSTLAQTTSASAITTSSITSTTGNLFICDASHYSTTFTSITDSNSNVYVDSMAEITSASSVRTREQYKANGTGGSSHTFTLTTVDVTYLSLACLEVSGAAASPLDQTASKADNSCTTGCTSTSTASTGQANELLIGTGSGGTFSNAIFTAQSGFTQDQNITNGMVLLVGHMSVSATGAYVFTFDTDHGPDIDLMGTISTWKAAAAAPTVARRRIINQ
jgi:hypothetical protein